MVEAPANRRNLNANSLCLKDFLGCEPECRSCEYRNQSYSESIKKKHEGLEHVIGHKVAYAPSERPFYYREKTVLRAFRDQDRLRFGFSRRFRDEQGRHRLAHFGIESCPAHSERVSRIVAWVRENASSFSEAEFPILYLVISGRIVTFVLKQARDPVIVDRVRQWLRDATRADVDGWYINWNPSAGFRVFDSKRFERIAGEAWSLLKVGQESFLHGPQSFVQNDPSLHSHAIRQIETHLEVGSKTSVVDLYGGMGVTAKMFSNRGANVLSVELSKEAVECSKQNAPQAIVLRGRVTDRLTEIEHWVQAERERGQDVVLYFNPPRTGLDDLTLRAIGSLVDRHTIRKFAYLSCNPSKMKRDLDELMRCARIEFLAFEAFDFFPHTRHVELLALGTLGSVKQ